MDRYASRPRTVAKKITFYGFLLLTAGVAIYWSADVIVRIQTQYSAAADATADVGMVVQKTMAAAERLAQARNAARFDETMREVRRSVYSLSLRHRSLLQGNPRLEADPQIATDLQRLYRDPSRATAAKVDIFLADARLLTRQSYRDFRRDPALLNALRQDYRNRLIPAIGETIRAYRTEMDWRTTQTVIFLAATLLIMVMSAIFIYLLMFNVRDRIVMVELAEFGRDQSVAPVLNGLTAPERERDPVRRPGRIPEWIGAETTETI